MDKDELLILLNNIIRAKEIELSNEEEGTIMWAYVHGGMNSIKSLKIALERTI